MKITKHYNHKNKVVEKVASLSKGEQFQLIKDNQRMLNEQPSDDASIDWLSIFEQTVSFGDDHGS